MLYPLSYGRTASARNGAQALLRVPHTPPPSRIESAVRSPRKAASGACGGLRPITLRATLGASTATRRRPDAARAGAAERRGSGPRIGVLPGPPARRAGVPDRRRRAGLLRLGRRAVAARS